MIERHKHLLRPCLATGGGGSLAQSWDKKSVHGSRVLHPEHPCTARPLVRLHRGGQEPAGADLADHVLEQHSVLGAGVASTGSSSAMQIAGARWRRERQRHAQVE